MSRFEQLENTFDLPRLEDSIMQDPQTVLDQAHSLKKQVAEGDHFALHDHEMDEIAELAVEYGKTLHDLGLQAEVKHAGEIFTASGNMLKIAVDARNAKMEKKLKLLRLELDRLKLDRTTPDPGDTVNQENVTVLDRNALLEQIRSLNNSAAK